MTFGPYPATVTRVIDGDTFRARLDLGFYVTVEAAFRIADVNAPELRSRDPDERERARAATTAMSGILRDTETITVVSRAKSFDRYVADVTVDGYDLATLLDELGHAERVR